MIYFVAGLAMMFGMIVGVCIFALFTVSSTESRMEEERELRELRRRPSNV
jgi:uncharacterized membrane-anchored protein YhcB (DUF1043 family)